MRGKVIHENHIIMPSCALDIRSLNSFLYDERFVKLDKMQIKNRKTYKRFFRTIRNFLLTQFIVSYVCVFMMTHDDNMLVKCTKKFLPRIINSNVCFSLNLSYWLQNLLKLAVSKYGKVYA